MKDLITTIGSLIILMMFLMQFTANQTTYTRIMGAEHSIKEFRVLSADLGSIKDEEIIKLKEKLSRILCCPTSEISVKVAEDSGDYSVTMPVYGINGPARIMGLSDNENMKSHTSCGVIILKEPEEEQQEEQEEES